MRKQCVVLSGVCNNHRIHPEVIKEVTFDILKCSFPASWKMFLVEMTPTWVNLNLTFRDFPSRTWDLRFTTLGESFSSAVKLLSEPFFGVLLVHSSHLYKKDVWASFSTDVLTLLSVMCWIKKPRYEKVKVTGTHIQATGSESCEHLLLCRVFYSTAAEENVKWISTLW